MNELQRRHYCRDEGETGLCEDEKAEMRRFEAIAELKSLDDKLARYPAWLCGTAEQKRKALVSSLSIDSWITRDIPKPDSLLGELLTTTARVFIVGRTGLGKTMFALGIATSVASGTGFLHLSASRPARVLYIDGEMPAELIKSRAQDAIRRLPDGAAIPAGNLLIFGRDIEAEARLLSSKIPPFAPLNTEAGRRFLLALLDAIEGVDLIIFDNVMSLITGDQKDEVPWSETLPLVQALSERCIGQLWLDHTGHNSDRQYGSSTKAWRFDAVGIMTPLPGKQANHQELAFTLSFDHPGKARRRTPHNWQQFAPHIIRLQGDRWVSEPAEKQNSKQTVALKPSAVSQHDALLHAIAAATTPGRTTKTAWYAECARQGLTDEVPANATGRERDAKMKPFRSRMSELVQAGWIKVDGEIVENLAGSDSELRDMLGGAAP